MFGKRQVTLERVEFHDNSGVFSSVAVLDPEEPVLAPEPAPAAPAVGVMERAKSVIVPFQDATDTEKLNAEVLRLSREQKKLFGIEGEAGSAILLKIGDLQRQQRKARAYKKFQGKKLKISNEVLTWRKPEPAYYLGKFAIPLPEVGLFGLEEGQLSLTSTWPHHGDWHPKLPHAITKLYEDVYEQLGSLALGSLTMSGGRRSNYAITAAFSGVIPTETKEKIREAQGSGAFSEIRVLAETNWVVEHIPIPFHADPIVVGLVDDEMWVIDVFDPTSLEDYIAREFTT